METVAFMGQQREEKLGGNIVGGAEVSRPSWSRTTMLANLWSLIRRRRRRRTSEFMLQQSLAELRQRDAIPASPVAGETGAMAPQADLGPA